MTMYIEISAYDKFKNVLLYNASFKTKNYFLFLLEFFV